MSSTPSSSVSLRSPVAGDTSRVAMYTEEFAADPHGTYAQMRRDHGPLVPVELAPGIPATLVIGYRIAVQILNDPEHFPADPRVWQQTVPHDSPILPMLEYRPNMVRSTGAEHARYRAANTSALDGVDLNAMHNIVEQIAIPLINTFCGNGSADLLHDYAQPLVFGVLNTMLGCPANISARVAQGMAAIFDGIDAERGNQNLANALLEHIVLKRSTAGNDITSRLIAHRSDLSDEEMIHQLTNLYGGGMEPQVNLIGNALLLMMTNDRFGEHLLGGALSTRDALDEVLFTDPPMANFAATYPLQPQLIGDFWLPAHQPVLISMAACNTDPEIRGEITGNRSHLSFSLGTHACPASHIGYMIGQEGIDQLLDALPDLELACSVDELRWRPGPFHRGLQTLPVTFPACAQLSYSW